MSCLLNKSPLRLIPCRLFHCVFSTEYLYTRWKGANLKHPYNLKFSTLSIDTHQALGSPSIHRCSPCPWLSLRRAGAKRLRGLTAPIPPKNYPQTHRTDSSYETASLHALSAHPSPPPFGRYLSGRERQEPGGNFRRLRKTGFMGLFIDAHCTLESDIPWSDERRYDVSVSFGYYITILPRGQEFGKELLTE